MRIKISTIIISISSYIPTLLLAATPTTINTHLKPGFDAIKTKDLKQQVSYLAHDALQGRLAMSEGDSKAIDWIVSEFKQIGLKPLNSDGYLQPVPIYEYFPDTKNSFVSVDNGKEKKEFRAPEISTQYPHTINIRGEVVFAGFGITAKEYNYDDYANVDVKGKVVIAFEHEPQEDDPHSVFNGTGSTLHSSAYLKAKNAEQHGAIALLLLPEPNRHHPSTLEIRARIYEDQHRDTPIPSQSLVEHDIHIPVALITNKVADEIMAGYLSLSQAQTAIDSKLQSQSTYVNGVNVAIHSQNTSERQGVTYNVVGLLEGQDDNVKHETIMISAHHDHVGSSGNDIWHGADDNASGTAGVVSLARAMALNNRSRHGMSLKRSVEFIVYTSEEEGLLGSYYMAAHPLIPIENIKAVINFDMIGRNEEASKQTKGVIRIPRNTSNRLNLIGGFYSPQYQQMVTEQNKFIGLTLDDRFDKDHVLNVFFRSDQFPYVLHHVPAFWWFTGFHPDYHHVTDTADKINYAKMQKILQLAYLTTYQFANEKLPAFQS